MSLREQSIEKRKKQAKALNNAGQGYRLISNRVVKENGIEMKVSRIECTCCNGILDFYYPNGLYTIPNVLKIEIIKKGKNDVNG